MANKSLAKEAEKITVLVTGGAGFIGSHTCVELLDKGYRVVVIDDFSNSSPEVISRIRKLTGADESRFVFYEGNVLDRAILEKIFATEDIDAIIHFAGFKAVGESVAKPLKYYWNNLATTLVLLELAKEYGVKNFIFSSSATVYGEPDFVPITEMAAKHRAENPYAQTKSMIEQILIDLAISDEEYNVVILRYFNPIGAHESGLLGEDPRGIPNNLVPYVSQVAIGKRDYVHVFGDDYNTPDGTGVRDYIHVVDLARGHVAALDWMGGKCGTGEDDDPDSFSRKAASDHSRRGVGVFNLGTGVGSSVFDVIHAYERACGHEIPYKVEARRPGDIASYYASSNKAFREMHWKAEFDLDRMCLDAWRWQKNNPEGYSTA
ncbi:MAG: UDP-glucose 4-epimerase GalE [Eggerthellaceae bacterium]|jgi:UDP-glucose 4-epimerase